MKLRTIGLLFSVAGVLCIVMAVDRYLTVRRSAIEVANMLNSSLESISIPIESLVAGLIGVMLLVTGVKILLNSRNSRSDNSSLLVDSEQ